MTIKEKVNTAVKDTKRILRLTRKPKRAEFNETAKITGIGMAAIGVVGFIIFVIAQLFR